jgi:hypothetical protein
MDTSYTLNTYNRITDVGGVWDSFASDNDGQAALAKKVIGGTIFDFVDGFDTASFLNAIFFAVRSKQSDFTTTYRCDGPGEKRLFRMHVFPLTNGGLRVDHKLIANRAFPAPASLLPIRQSVCENRCSVCCNIKIAGEWFDPFSQPDVAFSSTSYTVCPDCKALLRANLGAHVSRDVVKLAV